MTDQVVQTAASMSGAGLVIPAVLVVGLLIGAFVWGSRRQARKKTLAYRPGDVRGPRGGPRSTPEGRGEGRDGAGGPGGRTPSD
ncbi:DUF6479 family protein [Kitasatospora sp. NPDC056327]|uniref:DUF6479 family protein n=1 Tax=Kitasatospora sp. NPDC056327 TaxID=3345785 RepID=UPI0035E2EC73